MYLYTLCLYDNMRNGFNVFHFGSNTGYEHFINAIIVEWGTGISTIRQYLNDTNKDTLNSV